ncbi:MAG: M48 family metallopeptidase [Oscillospiraceae bacterium]|nr:M48 family metallopeptidase [Oscillospiraceae bacterium]
MKRTAGRITYELTIKDVKNMNLRIGDDLRVAVSANRRTPFAMIDAFVLSKEDWILAAIENLRAKADGEAVSQQYDDEECLAFFESISKRIFPLFAQVLNEKPSLSVKEMKSRWGVCHVDKKHIVLNRRLMGKPLDLVEYVVLHEYVHFVHPNHQQGFHALMGLYMPDYRQRRKRLNGH